MISSQRELKMPRTPFRQFCFKVVNNPYFEIFMLISVLLQCLAIVLEIILNPFPDPTVYWPFCINLLFALLYSSECALKVSGHFAYLYQNEPFYNYSVERSGSLLDWMCARVIRSSFRLWLILL